MRPNYGQIAVLFTFTWNRLTNETRKLFAVLCVEFSQCFNHFGMIFTRMKKCANVIRHLSQRTNLFTSMWTLEPYSVLTTIYTFSVTFSGLDSVSFCDFRLLMFIFKILVYGFLKHLHLALTKAKYTRIYYNATVSPAPHVL